jgi:copper chaperone CopZ
MATLTFNVAELTAADVAAVNDALATLGDAVESSDVNVDAGTVTVTTSASADDVAAALKATGKDVSQS